ncbi:MAG: glycosyltransferase family 2 protein [Flavobacteriaceae bacterium]|nr:glycosyltransferase family 2 protein [Flavobacteriaceae bacterium]
MNKVSIITPIYNVEEYIERCAVSLFEQDFNDIEYIFINDCTPDNSIKILERVIEKYPNRKPNVKILHHEENKGLGSARNIGLQQAFGEYILHIDSDDWCEVNMVSSLYKKAKETDADIVGCDFYKSYKERDICFKQEYSEDIEENLLQLLLNNKVVASVWSKIVRRDLYIKNKIYPPKNINFAEDLWLMIRLFSVAEKIEFVPKAFYHYWQENENAITNKKTKRSEKFWNDFKWVATTTDTFLIEKYGENSKFINNFRTGVLNAVFREVRYANENYKEKINFIYPQADKLKYLWKVPTWNYLTKFIHSFYVLNLGFVAVFLMNSKQKIKNIITKV